MITLWIGLVVIGSVLANLQSCNEARMPCGINHQDEQSCKAAGCCWDPNSNLSPCFIPGVTGYNFTTKEDVPGHTNWSLVLNAPSGLHFGTEFVKLHFEVTQETKYRTHIKIYPHNVSRYEVSDDLFPRPGGLYPHPDAMTTYYLDESTPIPEFVVRRRDSTNEILRISVGDLVFQDQYFQLLLKNTNGSHFFGFGESSHLKQAINGRTQTLWATDQPTFQQKASLYGSHPFLMEINPQGEASGLFLLNSNALQITNGYIYNGIQSVGGIIDLYLFSGLTPTEVIAQYLDVIGKPILVPYWSLGFHNCRWGYPNIKYVEEIVKNYSIAKIPLETQWFDIDYMDAFKDFTVDPVHFEKDEMKAFIAKMHDRDQHVVPIIDPGILIQPGYAPYDKGLEMDVFIKDLSGKTPYVGHVWPGETHFPDWFAANTSSYWQSQLQSFHDDFEIDGVWIDMNEIANFCNSNGTGQVCVPNPSRSCIFNATLGVVCCLSCNTTEVNKYDFPPFIPNVAKRTLGGDTIAMSSIHAGGFSEYDVHNLYGLMESRATMQAMVSIRKSRPFVLSRSTFPSSGRYTAHWTGDNAASWDDLKVSIVTMNNFAMFGIPMVGADICGFEGVPTEELCGRWIQVGAFSPFSRTHNAVNLPPQELFRWHSVAEISKQVLKLRYELLPYLYTLMYLATSEGSPVMNSLWTHFPTDPVTLDIDEQYMWSDSILFTPVLNPGHQKVEGYFPQSLWYSLFKPEMINASAQGRLVTLKTPLIETNVHVRGGSIISTQGFEMTTADARNTPYRLIVALDEEGEAKGKLFLDDGEQLTLNEMSLLEWQVSNNTLTSSLLSKAYVPSGLLLADIEILGFHLPGADESSIVLCHANYTDEKNPEETWPVVTFKYFPHSINKFSKLSITLSERPVHVLASGLKVTWHCELHGGLTPFWKVVIITCVIVALIPVIGLVAYARQRFCGRTDSYAVIN